MTRKTYGLIAGLIAAGVGAWWWRSRLAEALPQTEPGRATLIYDNTPRASTPDGNI